MSKNTYVISYILQTPENISGIPQHRNIRAMNEREALSRFDRWALHHYPDFGTTIAFVTVTKSSDPDWVKQ